MSKGSLPPYSTPDSHHDDLFPEGTFDDIDSYNTHPITESGRNRRKVVGALVAGAIGLAALGSGIVEIASRLGGTPSGVETSPAQINGYLAEKPQEVSADATDPRFRATAITILQDGFRLGTASLIRTKDGKLKMVTVEHVARPYADMPSVVHDTPMGTSVSASSSGKSPETDNRAFVPGFGLIDREDKPEFLETSGKSSPGNGDDTDLFSELPLSGSQQVALQEAEHRGIINVPERSTLKPALGDLLYMPSAQTGEKIPFLYLYDADGGYNALPLVVLNQDLNVKKGRAVLFEALDTLKQELQANGGSVSEVLSPSWIEAAVESLMVVFEKKYGYSNTKIPESVSEKLSQHLACFGDSGAPLLDKDGNTLGVLSSGTPFDNNPAGFDDFMRENLTNYSCLGVVKFDAVPRDL